MIIHSIGRWVLCVGGGDSKTGKHLLGGGFVEGRGHSPLFMLQSVAERGSSFWSKISLSSSISSLDLHVITELLLSSNPVPLPDLYFDSFSYPLASIVFGDIAILSLVLLLFFSQSQILSGKVQACSYFLLFPLKIDLPLCKRIQTPNSSLYLSNISHLYIIPEL